MSRSFLGRRLVGTSERHDLEYYDPGFAGNLDAATLARVFNAAGFRCPRGGSWTNGGLAGNAAIIVCDCGCEHWFKTPGWVGLEYAQALQEEESKGVE